MALCFADDLNIPLDQGFVPFSTQPHLVHPVDYAYPGPILETAIDAEERYLYTSHRGASSAIAKYDLHSNKVVDTLRLPTFEHADYPIIDDVRQSLLFFSRTYNNPTRIAKIDLSTFELIDTVTLPTESLHRYLIGYSQARGKIYLAISSDPVTLLVIDTETLEYSEHTLSAYSDERLHALIVDDSRDAIFISKTIGTTKERVINQVDLENYSQKLIANYKDDMAPSFFIPTFYDSRLYLFQSRYVTLGFNHYGSYSQILSVNLQKQNDLQRIDIPAVTITVVFRNGERGTNQNEASGAEPVTLSAGEIAELKAEQASIISHDDRISITINKVIQSQFHFPRKLSDERLVLTKSGRSDGKPLLLFDPTTFSIETPRGDISSRPYQATFLKNQNKYLYLKYEDPNRSRSRDEGGEKHIYYYNNKFLSSGNHNFDIPSPNVFTQKNKYLVSTSNYSAAYSPDSATGASLYPNFIKIDPFHIYNYDELSGGYFSYTNSSLIRGESETGFFIYDLENDTRKPVILDTELTREPIDVFAFDDSPNIWILSSDATTTLTSTVINIQGFNRKTLKQTHSIEVSGGYYQHLWSENDESIIVGADTNLYRVDLKNEAIYMASRAEYPGYYWITTDTNNNWVFTAWLNTEKHVQMSKYRFDNLVLTQQSQFPDLNRTNGFDYHKYYDKLMIRDLNSLDFIDPDLLVTTLKSDIYAVNRRYLTFEDSPLTIGYGGQSGNRIYNDIMSQARSTRSFNFDFANVTYSKSSDRLHFYDRETYGTSTIRYTRIASAPRTTTEIDQSKSFGTFIEFDASVQDNRDNFIYYLVAAQQGGCIVKYNALLNKYEDVIFAPFYLNSFSSISSGRDILQTENELILFGSEVFYIDKDLFKITQKVKRPYLPEPDDDYIYTFTDLEIFGNNNDLYLFYSETHRFDDDTNLKIFKSNQNAFEMVDEFGLNYRGNISVLSGREKIALFSNEWNIHNSNPNVFRVFSYSPAAHSLELRHELFDLRYNSLLPDKEKNFIYITAGYGYNTVGCCQGLFTYDPDQEEFLGHTESGFDWARGVYVVFDSLEYLSTLPTDSQRLFSKTPNNSLYATEFELAEETRINQIDVMLKSVVPTNARCAIYTNEERPRLLWFSGDRSLEADETFVMIAPKTPTARPLFLPGGSYLLVWGVDSPDVEVEYDRSDELAQFALPRPLNRFLPRLDRGNFTPWDTNVKISVLGQPRFEEIPSGMVTTY
jgi:hypothetical protein